MANDGVETPPERFGRRMPVRLTLVRSARVVVFLVAPGGASGRIFPSMERRWAAALEQRVARYFRSSRADGERHALMF